MEPYENILKIGICYRIWNIMKLRWFLRYQRVILAAFNRSFSTWSKILDTMSSSPYQWNGKFIEKGSYSVKVTQEEGKILQCVLILQGFQWIETGIPFDYTHSCISGPKSGDYTISWRSSECSYSKFMFWKSNEDIVY